MSVEGVIDTLFHGRLRAASRKLFWLGLALLVLGIAAIVFPMVSTLVATFLVGWVFLFAGAFMLAASFNIHGTGPFFGSLLLSLLSIASGLFLLFNPLGGEASLTLVVGALLMLQGAYELVFAFEIRPRRGWGGMVFSALASILLAMLIMAGWPGISVIALGILLGVNFITSGVGYMLLSSAMKPAG